MSRSIKNNIRLRGEKMAVESAERFDRYLITSSDLVKLEKYMIYEIPISNGWYSISVIDTTEEYRPLNSLVVVVLVVFIVAIIILTMLFINSNIKSIQADKLNNRLAATSNIYISVYDIDIINDTLEEIKSTNPTSSAIVNDKTLGAQEAFNKLFSFLPETSTKQNIKEFVDFSISSMTYWIFPRLKQVKWRLSR